MPRACLSRKRGSMGSTVTLCFFPTAGPWLLPGTSSLCPPATPHPQFGGTLPLSPAHSCERYPALRTHRPAPYPSPYAAHRNNSPSKLGAWGRLEAVRRAFAGTTGHMRLTMAEQRAMEHGTMEHRHGKPWPQNQHHGWAGNSLSWSWSQQMILLEFCPGATPICAQG